MIIVANIASIAKGRHLRIWDGLNSCVQGTGQCLQNVWLGPEFGTHLHHCRSPPSSIMRDSTGLLKHYRPASTSMNHSEPSIWLNEKEKQWPMNRPQPFLKFRVHPSSCAPHNGCGNRCQESLSDSFGGWDLPEATLWNLGGDMGRWDAKFGPWISTWNN